MTDAYERLVDAFVTQGCNVRDQGDRGRASTPGHPPGDDGCSFKKYSKGVNLTVWNGDKDQVLADLGLTLADLFDKPNTDFHYGGGGRIVTRYYDRKAGKKKFRPGDGSNEKDRSLYGIEHLPVDRATVIYVTEGEKDADLANEEGLFAVSQWGGAKLPPDRADWSPLEGRPVVVVADKNEVGMKRAQKVAAHLAGIAASVTVAEAADGYDDFGDHITAGLTVDRLVTLAENVEPVRPRRWRATDLAPAEQPKWLARNRIPRSAITILVGDEGIGKSLFWVLLVYHVTTGKPLPEFGIPAREPEPVVVIVTEDDWSSTVLPRLEVAHVDLSMVSVICTDRDGSGAPEFPTDMDLIIGTDPTPGLVIVDAWLDTVPAGLSVQNGQQARQALHPWKEAANKTGAAILLLTHTNRVATGNARDKYGATSELRKKARMTLFAQADSEAEGQLLIGPEKANSTGGMEASRFEIHPIQHFAASDEGDGTVPKLELVGDSGQTMRQHIADAFEEPQGGSGGADEWLLNFLGVRGSQKATEVYTAADANGYSKDQIKRAKSKLNKDAGFDRVDVHQPDIPGPWIWMLRPQGAAEPQGAR